LHNIFKYDKINLVRRPLGQTSNGWPSLS